MNRTYDIALVSLDTIIQEAEQGLRALKSQISPSGAWDCYCTISIDEEESASNSCDRIEKLTSSIKNAYTEANNTITVDLTCKPGMRPYDIDGPSGMMM
jgi:hypothetical protein